MRKLRLLDAKLASLREALQTASSEKARLDVEEKSLSDRCGALAKEIAQARNDLEGLKGVKGARKISSGR